MSDYSVTIKQCHKWGEDYEVDYATISEEQYKDVMWICSTTAESYMSIDDMLAKARQDAIDEALKLIPVVASGCGPEWHGRKEQYELTLKVLEQIKE